VSEEREMDTVKLKKVARIILIIVVVLSLLLCGGFSYLYFNGLSGMINTTEAREGQTKIACVGDSITYGHGITNWPKNNYPTLLQGLLGETYHVNSYGVSGRAVQPDSDQPYTALPHYQESLTYGADIVVFMMGTNDSKPENWHGADAFKEDLLALLDSYGDTEIILCTPAASFFVDGQTEGLARHDIQPAVVEEIAQIVRDVAAEQGYMLIDIYELTAQHPEWFAKDGIHPSNEGAAAIAQEVAGIIKE